MPAREGYFYLTENQSITEKKNFFQKNIGFNARKQTERKTIYIDSQLFAGQKQTKNKGEIFFAFNPKETKVYL